MFHWLRRILRKVLHHDFNGLFELRVVTLPPRSWIQLDIIIRRARRGFPLPTFLRW